MRRRALLGWLAAAVALKTGFRLAYFGAPLPLTAYLKLSAPLDIRMARGIVVLEQGMLQGLWLPLLGCIVGKVVNPGRYARLPLAVLASALAYEVYVGGDAWAEIGHLDRFVAPVLPVAMVGLAVFLAEVRSWAMPRLAVWLGAGVLAGLLAMVWAYAPFELAQSFRPSLWVLAMVPVGPADSYRAGKW